MNRLLLLLAISFVGLSCSQSENKAEKQPETQAPISQPEPAGTAAPAPEDLTPDLIDKVPAALTGCTGVFTYDSVALKNDNAIFVHTMQEGKGLLRIDGKTIALNLVETTEPGTGQKQEIFSAEHYKVILKTRKAKQTGRQEGEYKGDLEIYKDVSERKLKVHGKVTCQ